jgi:hypothetical protein
MTIEEVRRSLESDELYSSVAIANDFEGMLRRISRHETTAEVAKFVQESPDNILALVRYASQLQGQARETGYRFENDVALAICAHVLNRTASPQADTLIEGIAETELGSLRWVAEIARRVKAQRTKNEGSVYVFPVRPEPLGFQFVTEFHKIDTSSTLAPIYRIREA